MGINEDLQQIQSLDGGRLLAWLDGNPFASGSTQWWSSIFEAIEARTSILRNISDVERHELLGAGARLLTLGRQRDEITYSLVAYWQIRLAVSAMRSGTELSELAETLTPEGAVRWALSNMPASREEIVSYARERAAQYGAADDSFYATAGVEINNERRQSSHIGLVQDAERVLSALEWISLSRLGENLRAELEAWLKIRPELRLE
jgi:hypothetical protein